MKTLVLVLALLTANLRADNLEGAKELLNDTGYLEALLNMPWQEWQKLSPEQKAIFEERCEYNRELIETELAEFLVQNFSAIELEALRSFHRSELGHKWTAVTTARGGFEMPALFKAASRWQNGRYAEARSYVGSLEAKQSWKPIGYRGQVGDFTAKRGSGYVGGSSLDLIGGSETDFERAFGHPSVREASASGIVSLDAVWTAYRVGAILSGGKIIQVSFIRLPNEGANYADRMRTVLPPNECDAFLKDFARGGKWTAFQKVTYETDTSTAYVEGKGVGCILRGATLIFHGPEWSGRSVGP